MAYEPVAVATRSNIAGTNPDATAQAVPDRTGQEDISILGLGRTFLFWQDMRFPHLNSGRTPEISAIICNRNSAKEPN